MNKSNHEGLNNITETDLVGYKVTSLSDGHFIDKNSNKVPLVGEKTINGTHITGTDLTEYTSIKIDSKTGTVAIESPPSFYQN